MNLLTHLWRRGSPARSLPRFRMGGNGGGSGRRFGLNARDEGEGRGGSASVWSVLALAATATSCAPGSAQARPAEAANELDSYVDNATAFLTPILTNLGVSGIVGFCAAKALKVVGTFLAIVFGVGFVAVQLAVAQGYIAVNWSKLHDRVSKTLDTNHDRKLDSKDLKHYLHSAMGMLSHGVPSVGGFLAGFALGLR